MVEKWKNAVDKKNVFGSLPFDLSKPLQCISHELFDVKLHAYSLSLSALIMLKVYQLARKLKTKVGSF